MHLWTEYEGNTLAGYTVGRLSRSEGRSAFFLTTAEGQPALLRLTESHFDEGELIGRWRKIAAVSHAGLQAIRNSGQTEFDGVALAFCLLEPSDASLSDVLRERVLAADEAAEVAESVAGALAALHAADLVHGHVDAINVFAMGEVVKLRSDCARECTGDFEADTEDAREALRQRDVHDLGLLLRRCLTPQWEESTAMQLPNPFDRIVRRALNGTVSAAGIVAEMEALKPAPAVEVRKVVAAPSPATSGQRITVPTAAPAAREVVPVAAPKAAMPARLQATPEAVAVGGAKRRGPGAIPTVRAAGANSPAAISELLANRERSYAGVDLTETERKAEPGVRASSRVDAANLPDASLNLRRDRVRNRVRHDAGMESRGGMLEGLGALKAGLARRKVWVAASVGAAVLGFVLWNTTGGHEAPVAASAANNRVVPAATMTATAPPPTVAVRQPAPSAAVPRPPAQASLLASGAQAGWHVIAYTYNYEKQAEAKAMQLKQRYVSLQPQVYSPTGRAPYFVALGGPSDAVSAIALRNRARRVGLPRDTYARNF